MCLASSQRKYNSNNSNNALVEHFKHEPLARQTGQPLLMLSTLNKIVLYCIVLSTDTREPRTDFKTLLIQLHPISITYKLIADSPSRSHFIEYQGVQFNILAIYTRTGYVYLFALLCFALLCFVFLVWFKQLLGSLISDGMSGILTLL